MSPSPRVSVVMPSYNHAAFVGPAIESVLEQSFQDFELIVTDDGSTDGTPDVVRRYADPRIDLEVFPENRGACHAHNHGLARARGEYIAVLNSDDLFLPGKLERQVALLDADAELAVVLGLPQFIDESGRPMRGKKSNFARLMALEPEDFTADRFAWLRRFFHHGNALCHPTAMIRRRVHDEVGHYDVALRQMLDFDLWVRVCARYPLRVLPEPLTAFRVRGKLGNTSAPTIEARQRSAWEYRRILRHYKTMDDETLRRAFARDISAEIAARGLPMRIQLAMSVPPSSDPSRHLFALETIEEAIDAGVPGLDTNDLHRISGALDPFRIGELGKVRLQRDKARHRSDKLAQRLERIKARRQQ